MLTKGDDYPIHQTAEPIAIAATSDRNFYDRYFFNGYSRDGETFFAAALGVYPNRGIMDGAFSAIRRGRQYVVRASRVIGPERMDTTVGPLEVEVLEPLRRLRVRLRPNEWEMSGELEFAGRAAPIEEPRFQRRINGRLLMDSTRLTQHGAWTGELTIAGESIRVAPDRWWGTRDRSWGVRPVGEREGGNPDMPIQFFWLWAPMNFEDLCTHFDVNEDADGERWHEAGMVARPGGEVEQMRSVDYSVSFRSGTRHAERATIVLRPRRGSDYQLELRPLYNFQMLGIGYGHPQWGHGMYVGSDAASGESWLLSDVDPAVPLNLHIQAICEAKLGSRVGIGVFEQLIIGPHRASGFSDLLDMAP